MDVLDDDLEDVASAASCCLRLASSFFRVAAVDGIEMTESLVSSVAILMPLVFFFLAAVRADGNL